MNFWDVMCGSKGSVQYAISESAQLAEYQRLVGDQPKKAITTREPTVEDYKRRFERKLDLSDNQGGDDGERT
jgi:hypothetical protein